MKVEKSHDLPPARWRPRKPSYVTWSKFRGLRTKETNVNESQHKDKRQMPQLNMQGGSKKSKFFLSLLFCSIKALDKLEQGHPHWGGRSTLLSPLVQMLISSGNTITDTPGNNVSCGHPLA